MSLWGLGLTCGYPVQSTDVRYLAIKNRRDLDRPRQVETKMTSNPEDDEFCARTPQRAGGCGGSLGVRGVGGKGETGR